MQKKKKLSQKQQRQVSELDCVLFLAGGFFRICFQILHVSHRRKNYIC